MKGSKGSQALPARDFTNLATKNGLVAFRQRAADLEPSEAMLFKYDLWLSRGSNWRPGPWVEARSRVLVVGGALGAGVLAGATGSVPKHFSAGSAPEARPVSTSYVSSMALAFSSLLTPESWLICEQGRFQGGRLTPQRESLAEWFRRHRGNGDVVR